MPEERIADSPQTPASRRFLHAVWDPRTARVLMTALIFLLVLGFLHAAHETLTLFLFAILFAYFLLPLVNRLERPLKGRGKAIAAVYLLLLLVLALVGFVTGPRIADEGRELGSSLPSLSNRLADGELVGEVGAHFHLDQPRIHQLQLFLLSHRDEILNYGKDAAARLAEPAQKIWWLILIPILSLFFLKQGDDIAEGAVGLGRDADERSTIRGLLHDVNVMLGSYIRSQIVLAGMTLVAYTLVLSLLRVKYALILGPIAGFLEFIPVVGPAVAAVTVLAIAVLSGYSHAVWLIVFLGVWRLLQDYVSAPRIMGESLEINPLMQIFAVLAGAEIGGVVGALISVPVVAILRIIWRRITPQEHAEVTPEGAPLHPEPALQTD